MTTFQLSAFVFLALALAANVSFRLRRQASLRVAFAWSSLWIGAAVTIAWPPIPVRVAHFLGIARGADLVFYLAILGMFAGFFAVYVRFRRMESEMTRIVRELALRNPQEADSK